jgi:nicotinate phosphoribosyltransferase
MLDTDLYKLTMGQAIQKLFPRARARYVFTDRNHQKDFSERFMTRLRTAIDGMRNLSLTEAEAQWLQTNCPYLDPWYIGWLQQFRFNPEQVYVERTIEGGLGVTITGPWCETVYWEVPLLATISELYYEVVANAGEGGDKPNRVTEERAYTKATMLAAAECRYADFGTRRRRNHITHSVVVSALSKNRGKAFMGTSNVAFARRYSLKPIGTMAHEWIMGVGAMRGLRYANKYAMEAWNSVYKGSLGIALSDTYGTEAFLRDFDGVQARLFDGVRQDSGDPREFISRVCGHYAKLKIPLSGKTLIFSDGLDAERAIKLNEICKTKGIGAAFGIGTNLTNDDSTSAPLNIVIKLYELDGIRLAKLSDEPGKATGCPSAIQEARYVFLGQPL